MEWLERCLVEMGLVFSKDLFSCATFEGERKLSEKMYPCTMNILYKKASANLRICQKEFPH